MLVISRQVNKYHKKYLLSSFITDLCLGSRFVRSSVEEDDEDCGETQPSKGLAVNGIATNGVLEEGSPSEYTLRHKLCPDATQPW